MFVISLYILNGGSLFYNRQKNNQTPLSYWFSANLYTVTSELCLTLVVRGFFFNNFFNLYLKKFLFKELRWNTHQWSLNEWIIYLSYMCSIVVCLMPGAKVPLSYTTNLWLKKQLKSFFIHYHREIVFIIFIFSLIHFSGNLFAVFIHMVLLFVSWLDVSKFCSFYLFFVVV